MFRLGRNDFSARRIFPGLIRDVSTVIGFTAGVLRKHLKALCLSFGMKALSFPAGIAVVYAAQKALDRGIISNDPGIFLWMTGLGFLAFSFSRTLSYAATRIISGVKAAFSGDVNREFAKRFLGLDYLKARELSSAENAFLLDYDYRNIEDLIFQEIPSIASFFKIPVLFVLMFIISRPLAIAVLAAFPVMAFKAAWNSRRYEMLRTLEFRNASRYTLALNDVLLNLKLIKSLNEEEWALEKVNRSFRAKAERMMRTSLFFSRTRFFADIFSKSMMAVFGIIGGYMIMNGQLTLGAFSAVSMYAFMMVSEAHHVSFFVEEIAAERPSLKRSAGFIREIQKGEDKTGIRESFNPGEARGDIRYENVTFGYSKDRMLFRDASLIIPASKWTLIKGPSGSGKTTLLCLFLRLFDPIEGSISISGKRVDLIERGKFYNGISVVHQEAYLFNDSLINNVLFSGKKEKGEVEKALYCAGMDDLAQGLLLGYNTRVGEMGFSLSGGQKQRVAIARALARDPSVLFLDEATSHLDPVSEETILGNIRDEYPETTVVYVTHRSSVHRYADKAFTLSGGKIVEG